ncbi:MAG: hypothetical protein NWR52_03325, partial [Paracoccaceae bacterium]|nr:hypothetical protein [Paracoccaceae bacterium]
GQFYTWQRYVWSYADLLLAVAKGVVLFPDFAETTGFRLRGPPTPMKGGLYKGFWGCQRASGALFIYRYADDA